MTQSFQAAATLLLVVSICFNGYGVQTRDKDYHPATLSEAIEQLDIVFPDSTKQQIIAMSESDFLTRTHFSTGLWIRNEWLYDRSFFGFLGFAPSESSLRKELVSRGLPSNDDMSALILRSYYRHLLNQDLQVEQQIEDTRQYYINMNDPAWRSAKETAWWAERMEAYNLGDTLVREVYYDPNWLGTPRRHTSVVALIKDKSHRSVQISILSFGAEPDTESIYQEIKCTKDSCWVNPTFMWKLSKAR